MSTAPSLSDLQALRMDLLDNEWSHRAAEIEAQGREWTREEKILLDLAADKQKYNRQLWAEALESEGHRRPLVLDLDRDRHVHGIRVEAMHDRPQIYVVGPIGSRDDGVTAEGFRKAMEDVEPWEDIEVHVHSLGGALFDGVAIYNELKNHRGHVHAIVDGLAASAGSLILMGADRITMNTGSRLMIHEVVGTISGYADQLDDAARSLRQGTDDVVEIYMTRWLGSEASLRAALRAESWFTASEAIALGLADDIGSRAAIAASLPADHGYGNVPVSIAACASTVDRVKNNLASLRLHRLA